MRYYSLKIVLGALLCVAIPMGLAAQESKRVEVTTIYTPEVTLTSKLLPPATIDENQAIEPEIEYSVRPDTWQLELESHNFKPATAGYWDFDRANRNHLRISAGYPWASDVAYHFLSQNVRLGYFGLALDHRGSFSPRANADGVVRSIADSYDTQNHFSLNGGVVAGRQTFEASLDYDFSIYNSYAVLQSAERLYFNDAELKLRYGDSFVDLSRLNFGVELHGGGWLHTPPSATDVVRRLPEFRAGGSVRLAREWSSNAVGLTAEYDMWHSTMGSYRDMRFGAAVEYARDFGLLDVEASVGYLYDRVRGMESASHYILPKLHLGFDFGIDALSPYIDLRSSVSQNSLSQLYNENPFIDYYASSDMLAKMPNTLSYNLAIGLSGVAFSSRLSYNIAVTANVMREQTLWYISQIGLFGVDAGDNNRFGVTADVEYRPIGSLVLGARFYAHADNSNGDYVADDARVGGDFRIKYTHKCITLYLLGEYTGVRRWSAVDADGNIVYEAFNSSGNLDLRAGIGLRISRGFELYADGYNLLNSRIYDLAYYYRNGIGFMAGVRIDF